MHFSNIADLHMHILPNIDDGSPDMETSLMMLKEAHRYGITDLFATSHCFSFIEPADVQEASEAFSKLKDRLSRTLPEMHLYMGCEILCMERWMDRVLAYLSSGQFPSMNQSRYVLIEFTTWNLDTVEVFHCINRLLENGWIPILAHAERYISTFASLSFIEEIRRRGCLCQLNLLSLCEEKDREISEFARLLIQKEYIDFVGSDSHNMFHRPPQYESGLLYLQKHCSKEYLDEILYTNFKKYLF